MLKVTGQRLSLLFIAAAAVGVGVSYGPFYAAHIALLALATFIGWELIRAKGRLALPRLPTNLHLLLAGMFYWYALGMIWSIAPSDTARYLYYIAYGSVIVIVIVYTATDARRLSLILRVVSGVYFCNMTIALLESFTPFRWPISPLSNLAPYFGRSMTLDALRFDVTTLAVVEHFPTGFEWNPNNLATVMNLALPFVLFNPRRLVRWLGSALILVVIVMATSKANFLAFMLMLALYLFAFSSRRRRNLLLACCTLGVALAAGGTLERIAATGAGSAGLGGISAPAVRSAIADKRFDRPAPKIYGKQPGGHEGQRRPGRERRMRRE